MENQKILVIPDVHLRGWMFDEADRLMEENEITQAVCLGDLVDDLWTRGARAFSKTEGEE